MRQALQRFSRGELKGDALLRALTSFEEWLVPVDEAVGLGGDGPKARRFAADNGTWLRIFSDAEALKASLGDAAGLFLSVPGWWVFGNLGADLAGVELAGIELDREEPHAVHFRQGQLAMLKTWSDTLRVERLLHGKEEPEGFALLRRFDGFRMLMGGQAGSSKLILAPDQKGRKLAAIFTADDTTQAFLDGPFAQLGQPPPRVLQLTGSVLFEQLAPLPLTGIVFNCAGPVRPKAVAASFSQVVLADGKGA